MHSFRKIIIILILLALIAGAGYFIFIKKGLGDNNKSDNNIAAVQLSSESDFENNENQENSPETLKTFIFDNFHGSTDISDKFQFQYPANWYNEDQYFSPQKIQYYTKYEVKAPIYFDLVLAEIFHLTELNYQIENSKKKSPDTTGQIDGREFKRYDLVDYGSYGGDSAGRVKIFVGPKIKIDGQDYILVFHWEEKPLAEYMPDNSVDVFDNMLLTLKFLD